MSPAQFDTPLPPPVAGPPFAGLAERLAAGEVHRRCTPRLIALARRRLPAAVRARTGPESVVQSVYRSFFGRAANDEFALGD